METSLLEMARINAVSSSETRQIICKLHLSRGIIARGRYEYDGGGVYL